MLINISVRKILQNKTDNETLIFLVLVRADEKVGCVAGSRKKSHPENLLVWETVMEGTLTGMREPAANRKDSGISE